MARETLNIKFCLNFWKFRLNWNFVSMLRINTGHSNLQWYCFAFFNFHGQNINAKNTQSVTFLIEWLAVIDEWHPVTHSIPQWLVRTRMRVAKRSTRKVLCNNDGNRRLFAYRCFLQKMWAVRHLRVKSCLARAPITTIAVLAVCFALLLLRLLRLVQF